MSETAIQPYSPELDRELVRLVRAEVLLRESVGDIYQSLGAWTAQDRAFAISDAVGVPGNGSIFPPLYQDNTKSGECIPVYRSEGELKLIRDRMRVMAARNEFVTGALENRVNYIVSEGFKYTATPRNPQNQAHHQSAQRVRAVIDGWQDLNGLPELEAEALKRADVDGEFFLRRFPDEKGWDRLRFVEPEHVKAPNGEVSDPVNSFGCITPATDVTTVTGFWVVEDPHASLNPVEVPGEEIFHFRANVSSASKRGLPLFYSVEGNLKRCDDLLTSMSSLAKARARVALIRKIKGLTGSTGAAMVDKVAAARVTDPLSGQTTNIEQFRPGTVLTSSDNIDYEMPSANLGAADIVEVLQAELRAIAARLSFPEWMFSALADAKFNNAFISEGPTLKAFQRVQTQLCRAFGTAQHGSRSSLLWRQLRAAVEAGMLVDDDLNNVIVGCTGPSLESRDRTGEVTRHKAMVDAGFESLETAQRELELDPEVETPLIVRDRKKTPRPTADLTVISQVQKDFYAGLLPRAAAAASLCRLLELDAADAEALLPAVECVKRAVDDDSGPTDPAPPSEPDPTPPPAPAPKQTAKEPRPESPKGVVREQQEQRYSCALVSLPADLATAIKGLAAQIPDEVLDDKGRETDPHITVRYGLHTQNPHDVLGLVSGLGPVTFRLGSVSVFSGDDYDVVKVEVDSPDLHALHTVLESLPHTDHFPQYLPHVTLAYCRSGAGQGVADQFAPVNLSGTADTLIFSDFDHAHTSIPLSIAVREAFNEGDHPRDDHGQFVSGDAIEAAKSDPAKAEELRKSVTDPDQRKKLDAALGTSESDSAADDGSEHEQQHDDWWAEDQRHDEKYESRKDAEESKIRDKRDSQYEKTREKVDATRDKEDSRIEDKRQRQYEKEDGKVQDRRDAEDEKIQGKRDREDEKAKGVVEKGLDREKQKATAAIENSRSDAHDALQREHNAKLSKVDQDHAAGKLTDQEHIDAKTALYEDKDAQTERIDSEHDAQLNDLDDTTQEKLDQWESEYDAAKGEERDQEDKKLEQSRDKEDGELAHAREQKESEEDAARDSARQAEDAKFDKDWDAETDAAVEARHSELDDEHEAANRSRYQSRQSANPGAHKDYYDIHSAGGHARYGTPPSQ